ncbi:AAA family ATPase [Actibacterium sp. 188UL27-1]|nr:AAA family ATPase [Actibacterium sp. 188UL27-1]
MVAALAAEGISTVSEPGRRVLRAGGPDPQTAPEAFAQACLSMALTDLRDAADQPGPAVFDRSVIDALCHLERLGCEVPDLGPLPYHRTVLFAPPWAEIFVGDAERRHGFEAAVAEYDALSIAYPARGYDILVLPKVPLAERVACMRQHLAGLADTSDAG